MLEKLWSKENTVPLLVRVQTCIATLEIDIVGFHKIGNKSTSRPSNTTVAHIPKGCSTIIQGHLINYIYRNFIYNSKNLETAYMT